MRAELKKPLGIMLEGEPKATIIRLMDMVRRLKPPMFASVGDFVTENIVEAGIDPDIVVVDYRIMRISIEPMNLKGRTEIRARNPQGTIDADAWRAIEEAVTLKREVAVIVEGEEDLLVLPLIALMPRGSLIAYGQPHAGMVVVEVTEERKRWADGFMRRMEEN